MTDYGFMGRSGIKNLALMNACRLCGGSGRMFRCDLMPGCGCPATPHPLCPGETAVCSCRPIALAGRGELWPAGKGDTE